MKLGLKGKVALVTGGSKGIGKAIVLSLIEEGAYVCVCGRDTSALFRLKKELKRKSTRFVPFQADVTDVIQIHKMINRINKRFGKLDILINNAGGLTRFGEFGELNGSDWMDTYKLNVVSVVYLVKETMPLLKKSKCGRVIIISSLAAIQPGIFNPHYSASKAGLLNLAKHLSFILSPYDILVNTVCPGSVHSNLWKQNIAYVAGLKNISFSDAEKILETQEAAKTRLGRVGESDEIASAVIFLCSEKSSWTTGSCLIIDGGKLSTIH